MDSDGNGTKQLSLTETLELKLQQLPEVQIGKGLWQNKFHEYDVYEHTIKYVEFLKQFTSDPNMIVAGYLHDIGKPVVKMPKIKNGVLEEKEPNVPYHDFDDHEKAGEELVKKMDSSLFCENGLDKEKISRAVGAHYLPMKGIKKMRETKTYDEFVSAYQSLEQTLDKSGLERSEVMILFLADCLAKGKGCTDIEELKLVREATLSPNPAEMLGQIYQVQKSCYGGKE